MTSEARLDAATWTTRLAVLALLVSIAGVAFILAFDVAFLTNGRPMEVVFSLIPVFLIIDLSGVGGLLVIRRPGNPIGALLLLAGFCTAVAWGGSYYIQLDDLLDINLPLVVPIGWLSSWVFTPTFGLLAVFLPMLYPSGRLPGPRWRILAWIAVVAITIGAVSNAIAPAPTTDNSLGLNAIVLPEPLYGILQTLGSLSLLLAPPVIAISVGGLIARFRRSRGVERQQMKWFLSVASVAALFLIVSIVTTGQISDAAWICAMISMGCLPLAIGIAILRYRLYEIDRIVSRTVAYGAVTAVLVVTFAGLNLGLEAALASFTQASTLAVAASTLAVFALFQPLRRRVQSAVDHRFDRRRYEADRMAAGFAEHLRDEVDPDRLSLELDRVLAQTVAPTSAFVWLRGERQIEPGRGG